MSAFANCLDILDDFLIEAGELLEDADRKLVALESAPADGALLNDIFRSFHTVKGGAGFLEAAPLVDLCHKTENLFDQLRGGQMQLSAELLDLIMAATGEVRRMFGEMASRAFPAPAPAGLLDALAAAVEGRHAAKPSLVAVPAPAAPQFAETQAVRVTTDLGMPDWAAYLRALTGDAGTESPPAAPATLAVMEPAQTTHPAARSVTKSATSVSAPAKESSNSIRIETARFDHILNMTGEIGLTTNRLKRIKSLLVRGTDRHGQMSQIRQLEKAVSQLDMMVDDLRSAVMKARMQPVGRLFQKYSRLARDLSRSLSKDVDLVLEGEDTEVDKTILDELNDPLVHLVRNAIDHGVEQPADRIAAGKSARATVTLSAQQVGDQLMIQVRDDGRGLKGDVIRQKAVEKGLLESGTAASLSERQCLNLIFLPGFSTKDHITDISGRGVGMDVVQTNIRKLGGRIDITSVPGEGSTMNILLPLTLAILPVLMIRLGEQPLALPLSTVREILSLEGPVVQRVSGKPAVVVRGEVMPYHCLAELLGRARSGPAPVGVLVGSGEHSCVIGVDSFMGQDEVMIKPLEGLKPRGVAGATLSGDGELVLMLELRELLGVGSLTAEPAEV